MHRANPPAGHAETTTLTLQVPGLGVSEWSSQSDLLFEGLDHRDLLRLLTRADRVVTPHGDAHANADADYPVAALSLFADSGRRPEGYWLRADPVHIRTGQDHLIMAGGRDLAIRSDEADTLCAAINAHFADDGIELIAPTPGRWYFRWPQPPEICFSPLPEIIGDDLYAHMPGGAAGRYWRSLLNEFQMLMHAAPVNQARREEGRPEISGIWIWGGGALSAVGETGFSHIWSDDPLVRGQALHAGREPAALPRDAAHWLADVQPGAHLVFIGELQGLLRLGELEAWRSQLQALQRDWASPLRAALQQGRLDRLVISPGSAVEYHVTRRNLWRWWRRDRPLTAFD